MGGWRDYLMERCWSLLGPIVCRWHPRAGYLHLNSLAEGASREQILQSYPALKPQHIDAASHP
jgi:hypothetical protein